jgi:3-(3-hydroxy-phenyl)propionate hydroxylase
MPDSLPVVIVGAGPVGLAAAAALLCHGVPVTVLEAEGALSDEMRASTFHAPTLDLLDELGATEPLIAQGLVAPRLQYRSRAGGIIEPASVLLNQAA